ncbi:MAG: adenine deaminase [Anaerolineales bacterium]|nr:adenine deaminase [Anaerolineales bacterium]
MELAQIIKIARGDEPADLLLRNGRILNVFTGEIIPTNIAIAQSRIVGLGDYEAHQAVDLGGRYVAPGLIDSHVHIESAMVPPPEFARAVVPRGTTTVVTDPHEIANVLGLEGIRYMLAMAKYNPLSVYVNAPSCVPSTHMETTGAALAWYDLEPLLHEPFVIGLAEVMNFPGVVAGDEGVLNKIRSFRSKVKDGHCPGLLGRNLNAYVGVGIGSDHECTTVEEALEKLRLGMVIFIREATNAHNLKPLLPLITPENAHRLCFCTDDRQPADLLDEGHIDFMLRTAIAGGVPPLTAFRMATLNPAEYFRLNDRGAIAPSRRADLMVFSDLQAPVAELVYRGGHLVAQDGVALPWERPARRTVLRSSMNVDWSKVNLRLPVEGAQVRIMGAVRDQLITHHLIEPTPQADGHVVADLSRDILKMAVIERHLATGRVGELLSQPGFGFHNQPEAGHIIANLIDSARQFRRVVELVPNSPAFPTFNLQPSNLPTSLDLNRAYLETIEQGIMAAQYLRSWEAASGDMPTASPDNTANPDPSGAVLITPATTFLVSNRPVDYQFWLDAGSSGWWERIAQPLTHPYILTADWEPGRPWTDADEVAGQRDRLYRLVLGLTRRCRQHIFIVNSEVGEQGYEQRGQLLVALQQMLRQMQREETDEKQIE